MIKPYYQDESVTLYCADCMDVLPEIEGNSIPVLFCDPPYGHSNHDGDLNAALNEHRGLENKPIACDDADGFIEVVSFALKEAGRILIKDCCCCCCCCCGGGGPRPTFAWVATEMDKSPLTFFHSVIWDKRNPGLGWRFRRQHEMLMFAHKTGGKLRWNGDKCVPNIYSEMPPRERLHPNEKPLSLFLHFLDCVSLPGDTILDPFAGSGTTGVAAKALGRKAVLIEKEEKYCEIIVKRLAQDYLPLDVAREQKGGEG